MIEKSVDIFEEIKNHNYFDKQIFLLIPTNGVVKNNGDLVMGAGLAKTFVEKFSYLDLPGILGKHIINKGNQPCLIKTKNPFIDLISFPTKNNWKNCSKLSIIENSMKCLTNIINDFDKDYIIITSKLRCGLGGLNWLSVKKNFRAI